MKKKIIALLMTGILAAGILAGCGSKGEKQSAVEAGKEAAKEAETLTDGEPVDTPDSELLLEVPEEEAAGETAEDNASEEAAEDAEEEEAPQEEKAADETEEAPQGVEAAETAVLDVSEPLTGIHHASLTIKDYGTLQLELDADSAPITVTNFVKLAQEHFYDGLTFHRIIKDFMMQGGDPAGNGTGGSEEYIKGEFSSNGIENPIRHERGVISMARSQDPDSARSQFFIMHKDASHLDGDYAAFGHVTEGMDIVDQICEKAKPINSNGLIDTPDRPVIETIQILD